MEMVANDLTKFEEDIQNYEAAYRRLCGCFEELVTHMNDLNSMWEGEAHNQLLQTFETDRNRAQEFLNFLNVLLGELRFADEEYTSCERAVSSLVDSVSV